MYTKYMDVVTWVYLCEVISLCNTSVGAYCCSVDSMYCIRIYLDTILQRSTQVEEQRYVTNTEMALEIHVYIHVFRPIGLISMILKDQ